MDEEKSIPEYPDSSTLYADLREKWKHEDDLINQRVTWLLNSQAFLLAAFGVLVKLRIDSINKLPEALKIWHEKFLSPYNLAELLLVTSGVFVMYFLMKGISAAWRAMTKIKSDLKDHQENGRIWSKIRVDILTETSVDGASPSKCMSRSFFLTWILLAVYEILRTIGIIY